MIKMRHGPVISVPGRYLPFFEYEDTDLELDESDVDSRKNTVLRTQFSRQIWLNVPIVSASMDTVTESDMAIAMAEAGGLGIIQRFMPIERQADEVRKVKRASSFVIRNPLMLTPNHTVGHARAEMLKRNRVTGIVIVNSLEDRVVVGIVTARDLRSPEADNPSALLRDIMSSPARVAPTDTDLAEAKRFLARRPRIEKLPLVDKRNILTGLITWRDIERFEKNPLASRDSGGRPLVGAAVGIKNRKDSIERAEALVDAGVDFLRIDVLHGGLLTVRKVLVELIKLFPEVDIGAGNISKQSLAALLRDHGASPVFVGNSPGWACETRRMTGVASPQLTAVLRCAQEIYPHPLCADGGCRVPGDIGKALAAGATTVMLGRLLAGTTESPGLIYTNADGTKYKIFRGMASVAAQIREYESELESLPPEQRDASLIVPAPEGREEKVPYQGSVRDILKKLANALRSTMTQVGARTIEDMPRRAVFNPRFGSHKS